MSSLDRILRILNDIKIYNLSDKSLVLAEMKAYAHAFDLVYNQIDRILKGCFLDDIHTEYFAKFERLFSMPFSFGDTDERDKIAKEKVLMMKKRLSIKNNDFNMEGIKKALSSGGMEVNITEDFDTKTVTVTITKDSNICVERQEKEAFIKSFLPIHCKLVLK